MPIVGVFRVALGPVPSWRRAVLMTGLSRKGLSLGESGPAVLQRAVLKRVDADSVCRALKDHR